MTFAKFSVVILVGLVALTGCQNIKNMMAKRDNGSLDYLHAKKSAPIKLPADQASAPFVPLYEVPSTFTEVVPSTNDTGKQYQLPKPPRTH